MGTSNPGSNDGGFLVDYVLRWCSQNDFQKYHAIQLHAHGC